MSLGVELAGRGDTDEAIRIFERVLEKNPRHANALYNLADAIESQGKTAEARPHWRAYLEQEPEGRWANYARYRLFAG